jgi:hypothetical protein
MLREADVGDGKERVKQGRVNPTAPKSRKLGTRGRVSSITSSVSEHSHCKQVRIQNTSENVGQSYLEKIFFSYQSCTKKKASKLFTTQTPNAACRSISGPVLPPRSINQKKPLQPAMQQQLSQSQRKKRELENSQKVNSSNHRDILE